MVFLIPDADLYLDGQNFATGEIMWLIDTLPNFEVDPNSLDVSVRRCIRFRQVLLFQIFLTDAEKRCTLVL